MIEFVAPGALTTIQDTGRPGFGSSGVPPSGAFDLWALRVANLLVGNDAGAAALECTLVGPTLRSDDDAVIALVGSRFDSTIDGAPAPFGVSFPVRSGAVLTVGRARGGARCIVAVRGGIAVDPVLGSRSTHVRARLGPPVVATGHLLPVGPGNGGPLRRAALDEPRAAVTDVRVMGDLDGAYTVTGRADRAGVRLEGPRLEGAEVEPQANPLGAIQVPPDGNPIILGPDRPVTGGYRTIGCVVETDVPIIANARPGDTLRFVSTTLDQARTLLETRERTLRHAIEEIG